MTYPKLKREYKKKSKCAYCCSTDRLTIDHKVPKIDGGTFEHKNLQTLCYRCNVKKSRIHHRKLMNLFRWHAEIEQARAEWGKKPLVRLTPEKGKSNETNNT